MEQFLKECRIPLLWNANGNIEVIRQDDISAEEADRIMKLFKGEYSLDEPLPKSCAPSPSPSVDFNNDADYHERMSLIGEGKPSDSEAMIIGKIEYCMNKQKPATQKYYYNHRNVHHLHQQQPLPTKTHKESDRVYSCPLCSKMFSRKFNLNTHIKCVHSDEKDYICPYCQRAFNHSSNLRKHMKTVHGEEKRIPCPHCHKPFKHAEALRSHLKVIHGKFNS